MSPRIACGLVLLMVVVKLATTFPIANTDPLWLDELHTAWSSEGGWQQISQRALAGNQTPLYFWLTAGVRTLGESVLPNPNTVALLRLTSVLSGGLLLIMAALFVWNATRSIAAIACVGLLVLIEPTLLFYSTEARPYALMQCLGLIQVLIFWSWLNGEGLLRPLESEDVSAVSNRSIFGWGKWSLAISSAILVNVHLTSIWLLIAEAIFFVGLVFYRQLHADSRPDWRELMRLAGFVAVLVLILTVPTWPAAAQVANRNENWSSVSSSENLLLEARTEIGWGIALPMLFVLFWKMSDSENESEPFNSKTRKLSGTLPALEVEVGCVKQVNHIGVLRRRLNQLMNSGLIKLMRLAKHTNPSKPTTHTLPQLALSALNASDNNFQLKALLIFVFLWGVVPFVSLILMDAIQGLPFSARRYTLIGTTAFPIFSGLCIGILPRRWIRNASLLLLITAHLFHQSWLFQAARDGRLPQLRNEDWFSVISEINQNGERSKAPIFLFANLLEDRQAFENQGKGFQDYLGFPLKGDPKVEEQDRSLIVFPTLIPNSFRKSDWEMARDKRGAWLIIRGQDTLVEEVLSEIRSNADSQSSMSIETATFSQSPWSDVRLFWIGF